MNVNVAIPHDDVNIRQALGEDVISNLRFLTLKPSVFAAGPAAQNWLTAEEKSSILKSHSEPDQDKSCGNLCDIKTCRELDIELNLAPGSVNNTKTICLTLPKTGNNFSEFNSTHYVDHFEFSKDICINSITLYSQTNNPDIIKTNKLKILDKNYYSENCEARIGKFDQYSQFSEIATFTCNIPSVPYNALITLKSDKEVKLTKNTIYGVIIKNLSGYYPLCDRVEQDTIFRYSHVDLKWSYIRRSDFNSYYSLQSPLHSISYSII